MKTETQRKPVHSKRAAREAALKALYSIEVGHGTVEESLELDVIGQEFTPEANDFIKRVVGNTLQYQDVLDAHFSGYLAAGWQLDRIAVTDKLALRMACYELWYEPEIPPKVVLSEYVTLAKNYGSNESGKFVNGVLAKVLPDCPKADWNPEDAPAPAKKSKPVVVEEAVEEPEEPKSKSWVIKSDR